MTHSENLHFTDSHAHITMPDLIHDIENIIARANTANVKTIINICTDVSSLNLGLELRSRFPRLYHAAATTPHDVEKEGEDAFPYIAQKAHKGNLVAIGETGLDYYYEYSSKSTQKKFLKKYLHLSLETKLPIIIHCREAFPDLFEILDSEYRIAGAHAPHIIHCFTGTVDEAKEIIKRGGYISFSGIVTFKKSHELREAAKVVPLKQMLIETDTPYLAPQSHRGKRNEPSYLPEIAATIAKLKGVTIDEFAKTTTHNAYRFFKLDLPSML